VPHFYTATPTAALFDRRLHPEEEWEKAWRIGEAILKNLIILDESGLFQPVNERHLPVMF